MLSNNSFTKSRLIYRYRWQIELFFKWFKCILGCRHLMAESPEGVPIQT